MTPHKISQKMRTTLGSGHTSLGVPDRLQTRLSILESLRLEGVIEMNTVTSQVAFSDWPQYAKDEANVKGMGGTGWEMADDA